MKNEQNSMAPVAKAQGMTVNSVHTYGNLAPLTVTVEAVAAAPRVTAGQMVFIRGTRRRGDIYKGVDITPTFTFGSVAGVADEYNGLHNQLGLTAAEAPAALADEMDRLRARGLDVFWAIKNSTAVYGPGYEAHRAAEDAKRAAALWLTIGQLVVMEGMVLRIAPDHNENVKLVDLGRAAEWEAEAEAEVKVEAPAPTPAAVPAPAPEPLNPVKLLMDAWLVAGEAGTPASDTIYHAMCYLQGGRYPHGRKPGATGEEPVGGAVDVPGDAFPELELLDVRRGQADPIKILVYAALQVANQYYGLNMCLNAIYYLRTGQYPPGSARGPYSESYIYQKQGVQ